MKLTSEKPLRDFEFWSGAKDTVDELTEDELDTIEAILEDAYPEGMDETHVNDFFWFDRDTIADWLGYSDWEALLSRGEDDEDDEDEEDDE
jgi:hypothetical protein